MAKEKSVIKQLQQELGGGEGGVNQPGGLHTDNSLVVQPEGKARFVLNGINETTEGDFGFLANEESNAACYSLPTGYVPLGQVYIGDENTLLFLTHPTLGHSSLAIVDRECNLTVIVTDANQVEKFGFKVSHQISATFRLRRGCERTIYWVDPKPRTFIIDKEENFKDKNTQKWVMSKFNLFKFYNSIPTVSTLKVLDSGGQLLPGSYNFSIQYLDEGLNPTEFVTSTETMIVYHDDTNLQFRDTRGSTSTVNAYLNFGKTDKAIIIKWADLDKNFPFYRLAITEANTGSGLISDTKYTSEISTSNDTFIYTGVNFETSGTQEDVTAFGTNIEKAEHIEQIDNMLLLGNVKGKEINLCNLQKYASRITADVVTKNIVLTSNVSGNPKFPSFHNEGVGYMPGEIYSFGIVYIFEDNTTTPVYHIPGKNPTLPSTRVFTNGSNIYPMSNDNQSIQNEYTDNVNCGNSTYWGLDSEGDILLGEPVRHHRFPLRTDINLPFVTKASGADNFTYSKRLSIKMFGEVAPGTLDFQFRVTYTVDGVSQTYVGNVEKKLWSGITANKYIEFVYSTDPEVFLSTEGIYTITLIEEEPAQTLAFTTTAGVTTTTTASTNNMKYSIQVEEDQNNTKGATYSAPIMGIQFSNIQIPNDIDTNGNKITGYYIVRNERTVEEKTVLDSAVLTPTLKNKNFVSHGHIMPEILPGDVATRVKKDIVSIISPEFKFNDERPTSISRIIQQGSFVKEESVLSRFKTENVLDGTSYDSSKHKDGHSDDDGWTLHTITRDNITNFVARDNINIPSTDIKSIFYLDALADKFIKDKDDKDVDVFNLAADNKIGIVSLAIDLTEPIVTESPYVYIVRDNANPYSNFRLTPYFKDVVDPTYFADPGSDTCQVFGGDSYISSMKYVNSIFYDNRVKLRAAQTSAWNYIGAALLTIVAVVLLFIPGLGTAAAIGVGALAAGLVAAATTLTLSGIKQDAWARAYGDLYDKGLRDTIGDNIIMYWDCASNSLNNDECKGFKKNPSDDEIEWFGESTNYWFESAVNMNWRHGNSEGLPDFLPSPGLKQLSSNLYETDWEFFGTHQPGSYSLDPSTVLDGHMFKKLTTFNTDRKKSGREYIGLALPEMYLLNADYKRRNKQKLFNHLALEYDCCSDCTETFPHRVHYSEQSFQEELIDNYRTFLPNNYKDIEGETGVITDLFRIQNNLFIHTESSLWHLPQNIQERVTGDIVSFIGTGSYFSIPPRKMVDDSNSSAGNMHKWGRVKTKYGVLFPSYKEKKWYLFNGESLQPISDVGMTQHFKKQMNFMVLERHYNNTQTKYPYPDNPVNPIGIGYLSTYDSTKERLIVSKKDFEITNLPEEDYAICNEGIITVFDNLSQTIADRNADGWDYMGIEECRLKFQKTIIETRTEIRYEKQEATVFSVADYLVFQYIMPTGYNDLDTRTKLNSPVNSLVYGYGAADEPDFTDYIHWSGDNSGFGLESVLFNTKKLKEDFPANNNIIFEAASWWFGSITSDCKLKDYDSGEPLCESVEGGDVNLKAFVYQGGTMALSGFNFVNTGGTLLSIYNFPSINIPMPRKATITNSMSDGYPMGTYNLNLTTGNFTVDGVPVTPTEEGTPPPPTYIYVEVEVEVDVPVLHIEYEDGTVTIPEYTNNSWTMSYSLKRQEWVSHHSYLPDFYFHVQEKFYSWKNGLNSIYRHNVIGNFQTFYETLYPFIVEYVDNSNPLSNKIWDSLMFQTEAKKYNLSSEEYVDERFITFTKMLVYNTQQISGELGLVVKSNENPNYLLEQTKNLSLSSGQIPIDRNERDWTVNDLRDLRVNYNLPMFKKDVASLQTLYYIDKIVNSAVIDPNKNWTELESFRDKFLAIRLIFDTFADTRLIFNFSNSDRNPSER